MFYFILLVSGFGLVMLYLIVMLCKEAGKLENTAEIQKELDKQREKSKERDNLPDDALKEWLERYRKKEK